MSVSSFNNTQKSSILANSAPTSPTYSSSPTHSMFAMQQTQKTQKRLKSRFQKHLRKPPSFDTYLLRRTNSVSSVSSTSSYDSNASTTSNEDQTIVLPQAQVQTTPHANQPSLIRRVSTAIRFTGLFDGPIPDDSSSVAYSSSSDWDPRDDDNDEEEEEEFEFINARNACHRSSSFSSGY